MCNYDLRAVLRKARVERKAARHGGRWTFGVICDTAICSTCWDNSYPSPPTPQTNALSALLFPKELLFYKQEVDQQKPTVKTRVRPRKAAQILKH